MRAAATPGRCAARRRRSSAARARARLRLGEARRSRAAGATRADARAADGHDAHLLVRPVAELGPQPLAVAELGRVEPGDVAGEVEVLAGPVADRRQVGRRTRRARCPRGCRRRSPGRARAGSARCARSSRRCSRRSARPRARRRRASAASRRSRSARRTRRASAPGSRAGSSRSPSPRRRSRGRSRSSLHEVVEDHEVGDEDLVHPPPCLEAVQVVLGGLGLDVARLVGQRARWPGGRARRAPRAPRVTGCWASQSISRSGCSRRSSRAIATSRRAWPRPIGEEM